eukprot:jgi/Bigna1/78397/fgenesh1_pg.54_\
MKVLLIRHAQSTNNETNETIKEEMKAKKQWRLEARREYYNRRSADPAITVKGAREAEALGEIVSKMLKREKKKALIYTSPLQRTILTASPLARKMDTKIFVKRDIYEVYGFYETKLTANGEQKHSTCPSPTRKEIHSKYSIVGDSDIQESGPWYQRGHRETEEEAEERAAKTVRWITSKEMRERVGEDKVLIIVTHGHFIDKLIKSFMAVDSSITSTPRKKTLDPRNTSIMHIEPHPIIIPVEVVVTLGSNGYKIMTERNSKTSPTIISVILSVPFNRRVGNDGDCVLRLGDAPHLAVSAYNNGDNSATNSFSVSAITLIVGMGTSFLLGAFFAGWNKKEKTS